MGTYKQLTQEARYQIYALKKTGHTSTEIATVITATNQQSAGNYPKTTGKKDIVLNRHTAILPQKIRSFQRSRILKLLRQCH